MPTPSLLIVPARFKTGTLYSQIPVPVAPSTSSVGDFTVTRATSATRVNASGLIESAKTNLCLQSAGFEVSGNWSPSNINVTTGTTAAFTAPDGSTDADLLTSTTSTGSSSIGQSIAIAPGPHSLSVFAKAGNYGLFRIGNVSSAERAAWFNLDAGAVTGTVNGGTASMQNYGNGWYRCIFTPSAAVSGSNAIFIGISNAVNQTTGLSGSTVYFWGAQVEVGSSASEYIPTTTVARTRFAGVTVDGTSAINIPRLDYFASGGVVGCPALLVEPSAQNICLQSQNFFTTWSPTNAAITTGSTAAFTAPDGSTGAYLLTDNATLGRHRVQQTGISITSGTTYAFSILIKKNSSNRFLLLNASSAFNARAALNLDNLAITNINGSGAAIENYGNGWYRFSIRGTATTTKSDTIFVQMQDAATDVEYIGNGSSFYIWGAQVETGSVATSYIPTTTAAVTRNADTISVSGAVSGSIGQTEGTIYAEVTFAGGLSSRPTRQIMNISDGTDNNRAAIYIDNNTTTIYGFITANGSNVFNNGTSFAGVTSAKIAIAYKSANYAIYVNGVVAASGTTAFSFATTLNQVTIGSRHNFIGQFNDRIRAAALYTTRLTDEQLQALTT